MRSLGTEGSLFASACFGLLPLFALIPSRSLTLTASFFFFAPTHLARCLFIYFNRRSNLLHHYYSICFWLAVLSSLYLLAIASYFAFFKVSKIILLFESTKFSLASYTQHKQFNFFFLIIFFLNYFKLSLRRACVAGKGSAARWGARGRVRDKHFNIY